MYEAEHAAQPEVFDNVLTGLYWAVTTMTSTGYGDVVSITPLGRLIDFVVMAKVRFTINNVTKKLQAS